MKVLRSTMYEPSAIVPHPTAIAREADLKLPIDEAILGMEMPGVLVLGEVFESDIEDKTLLTQEALKRYMPRREREENQALLFYWDAEMLERTRPTGIISGTQPAPLNVEEITTVLRQLAKHPSYKGQTVIAISEDYKMVRMKAGKVEVEEMKA